jgi:hypothetical protein
MDILLNKFIGVQTAYSWSGGGRDTWGTCMLLTRPTSTDFITPSGDKGLFIESIST